MEWLSENWGNIVVIAALVAILTGIVIHLVRKKRNGCGCDCGCGCGCCGKDSCSHKE